MHFYCIIQQDRNGSASVFVFNFISCLNSYSHKKNILLTVIVLRVYLFIFLHIAIASKHIAMLLSIIKLINLKLEEVINEIIKEYI